MHSASPHNRPDAIRTTILFIVAMVPFMPRPTFEHATRILAPLAMILLFAAVLIWLTRRAVRLPASANVGVLFSVLTILLGVYAFRVLNNAEWHEAARFAGRAVWLATYGCFIVWMLGTAQSIKTIYSRLYWATLALSLLIILVGVTGISLLEAPRPPRTYGIQLPFFKTPGIPRSFGELGIFFSIAWSYFLVFGRSGSRAANTLILTTLVLATLITQSRSIYLSVICILAGAGMIYLVRAASVRTVRILGYFAFLLVFIIPVLLELAVGLLLGSGGLFGALMGESTYAENVLVRFLLVNSAVELLLATPDVALLGVSHQAWLAHFGLLSGEEASIHNHFVASLVSFGLLAGGTAIALLFVWPLVRTIRRFAEYRDNESRIVLLSMVGIVVNLHFYQGFFSIVLAIALACLWYVSRGQYCILTGANAGGARLEPAET